MDTLYTFWDNIIHYKTKSIHFLGLKNSATKLKARPALANGPEHIAQIVELPLGTNAVRGSGLYAFGLGFRV